MTQKHHVFFVSSKVIFLKCKIEFSYFLCLISKKHYKQKNLKMLYEFEGI